MSYSFVQKMCKIEDVLKALQPEILKNELGKFIPFIFIEWIHLKNAPNCPQYEDWVNIFFEGGYYPANPGSWFWQ